MKNAWYVAAVLYITSGIGHALLREDFPLVNSPPEEVRSLPAARDSLPEYELTRTERARQLEQLEGPVQDEYGRTSFIVQLTNEAAKAHIGRLPEEHPRLPDWHRPEVRSLIAEMEVEYGLSITAMTSWMGASFAAFLNEGQVSRLSRDSRVAKLVRDTKVEFSAPLWNASTGPQGQIIDWGINAQGGSYLTPNTGTIVYVLDSGVSYHPHLSNIIQRVAPHAPGLQPVGCYGHASQVAGIVGATGTSSLLPWGVVRGVPIISVAVGTENHAIHPCSLTQNVARDFDAGLDWIYYDIMMRGVLGIVNVSANGVGFRSTELLGEKLLQLATPTGPYVGALVVQSAGNQGTNACNYAYDATDPYDGIVVVGGIDAVGQPVVKINGRDGYVNPGSSEPGSNYGSCVEAWAPSSRIYSAWYDPAQPSALARTGSGTSFAAPHISGMAAYGAAAWGPVTPGQLEYGVRSWARLLGSTDKSNPPLPVTVAMFSGTAPQAKPAVQILFNGKSAEDGPDPVPSNQGFSLQYDSYGAASNSCGIQATANGQPWYYAPKQPTSYDWGGGLITNLYPGTYSWTVTCAAPGGAQNSSSLTAVLTNPLPPSASFFVDFDVRTGQTLSLSSPFVLRYSSTHATTCDLTGYKGPIGGTLSVWYTQPGWAGAYSWGLVALTPGEKYRWAIACHGPGGTASADLTVLYN